MASSSLDSLKDAVIAQLAHDFISLNEKAEELKSLLNQMNEAVPKSLDVVRSGIIDTLADIEKGISEAGGERIEHVKGQLSAYIEQAVKNAFENNDKATLALLEDFKLRNHKASEELHNQFIQTSEGMDSLKESLSAVIKEANKAKTPTWVKVWLPITFVFSIACTALVSWQLASYKEAVYSNAFNKYIAEQSKSHK